MSEGRKPVAGVPKGAKPRSIAVFGSRTLHDDRVRILIMEAIEKEQATRIVTAQEPVGVCEVGQRVAKDLAIPLEVHFLNFKHLQGAFDRRSRAIVKAADAFVIVHDGVSKGTTNEMELVRKCGKPMHYHVLEPLPGNRNVGFNLANDFSVTKEAKKDDVDEDEAWG